MQSSPSLRLDATQASILLFHPYLVGRRDLLMPFPRALVRNSKQEYELSWTISFFVPIIAHTDTHICWWEIKLKTLNTCFSLLKIKRPSNMDYNKLSHVQINTCTSSKIRGVSTVLKLLLVHCISSFGLNIHPLYRSYRDLFDRKIPPFYTLFHAPCTC